MSTEQGRWVKVLACAELLPGEMRGVEIPPNYLVVYNVAGTFYVTDNICTHAFAILSDGWLDDSVVECPLHGGRFDVTNGKVVDEPADCDLRTYRVRIAEDMVEVLLGA